MAYRPSSHPPETAWARHLDQVRRDRDWSATALFEYVREPLHLAPKSRSAFVDRLHLDPRPAYIPVLRELFGEPPAEPEATKEPGDLTGLVSALTAALLAQAQALTDIRLELAQAARDAAEEREATGDVLARLEAQLEQLQASVDSGAGTADPRSGRRN